MLLLVAAHRISREWSAGVRLLLPVPDAPRDRGGDVPADAPAVLRGPGERPVKRNRSNETGQTKLVKRDWSNETGWTGTLLRGLGERAVKDGTAAGPLMVATLPVVVPCRLPRMAVGWSAAEGGDAAGGD